MQKIIKQFLSGDAAAANQRAEYTWKKDEVAWYFCPITWELFKVQFTGEHWLIGNTQHRRKIYQYIYLETTGREKLLQLGSNFDGISQGEESEFYTEKLEALRNGMKTIETTRDRLNEKYDTIFPKLKKLLVNDKMKIFALSKSDFDSSMKKNNITNETVKYAHKSTFFISINDPSGTDEVPYFEDCHVVKVLYFHDIEEDLEHPKHGTLKAFTLDQARELVGFIDRHKDKDNCIIHCAAGISRSGAVATFINDFCGCDFFDFKKNNPHIHPNGLVLRLLKQAANELPIGGCYGCRKPITGNDKYQILFGGPELIHNECAKGFYNPNDLKENEADQN